MAFTVEKIANTTYIINLKLGSALFRKTNETWELQDTQAGITRFYPVPYYVKNLLEELLGIYEKSKSLDCVCNRNEPVNGCLCKCAQQRQLTEQ